MPANDAELRAKIYRLSQNNPNENERAAAKGLYEKLCREANVDPTKTPQEPSAGSRRWDRQSHYNPFEGFEEEIRRNMAEAIRKEQAARAEKAQRGAYQRYYYSDPTHYTHEGPGHNWSKSGRSLEVEEAIRQERERCLRIIEKARTQSEAIEAIRGGYK